MTNKIIPYEKSFASHEKAQYWSDKNEFKPNEVFKCSNTKFCFNCNICNHEFDISPNNVNTGYWCPYCVNKLCDKEDCNQCFEKSFNSHEKSKYWSNKNKLKARQVSKNSHKKYWFICECKHEFEIVLSHISRGSWCSYCSNPPKILCDKEDCNQCFEKSFASHEKAQYWSNKNLSKPRQKFKSTHDKYWFKCDCGHEFEAGLNHINTGKWCPYCCNPPLKLCEKDNCNQCIEKSFISNEKSKFWSDKNKLKARQVFKNAHTKYLFNCDCGHEFEGNLYNIIKGVWCSYCSNPARNLCDKENCNKCFEKSFASNEKSKYWSNKNKLKPRQVFKSTNDKYWFNCNCGHEFEAGLDNITNEHWCSYCSNNKLCDKRDCNQCFEKSFASHEKAQYWSNKNKLKPRQTFKNSNNVHFFDCDCGHEFDSLLSNISKGQWCPYCSNPPKLLCYDNNCKKCFNKSFASHEKAKYWSDKNDLQPRYVFKGSNTKYIFTCKKKHIFIKSVSSINQGSWCPYCVNKTEQKLYDKLITLYPTLQQQFKVDWCKNKRYLPFDFVIPENKIIIELDGRQHFEQVRNWDDPKKTQENDKYKMKCANDNNYSVIRILQEDVFYDSYDWLSELNDNIKNIIKNKKVENIYMCKDNEYDVFN